MKYSLKCTSCGRRYGEHYKSQACEICEKNLEVVYNGRPRHFYGKGRSFWDYESALPSGKYRKYKLGGTSMVKSHDEDNLFLKLEIENPTRSFKDRGSVIEIAKAKEYGYSRIVCASTGNMAYSLAYYAELEGMDATVFIGGTPNKDKLRDIKEVGDAETIKVKGDFNKALDLAYAYSKKHKAFLTGDYCYRKEGQKTLAYEIIDQLPFVTHIIVPVGNATLISGIFKGMAEMKNSGRIRKYPKIIGVQAEKCSPLVKAFKTDSRITYQKPKTAADAIAVGYPTFGGQGLEAIRLTGGTAISVTEKEMIAEQKRFHKEYGLISELAGVASIIASRKIKLSEHDEAVAVVSGGNI